MPYLSRLTSLINVRNTRGEGDELIVEDLLKELPATPAAMAALRARVMASRLYPNLYISEDGRATALLLETLAYSPGEEEQDLTAGFAEEEGGEKGGVEKRPPLSQA